MTGRLPRVALMLFFVVCTSGWGADDLVERAADRVAAFGSIDDLPAGRVLVVGVLNADGSRWYGSAGVFEPGSFAGGDRADKDTLFEIGSISKTFAGTALASFLDEGALQLTQTVGEFVPKATTLDPSVAAITLEQLATHTSGLPRIARSRFLKSLVSMTPYGGSRETLDFDLSLLTVKPTDEPSYSNMGAGLLGDILSRHAGRPYEEVIAERVTGPLGLENTAIELSDEQSERLAPGYFGRSRAKPWSNMGTAVGAGGLRSTAEDLLTYAGAVIASPAGRLGAAVERATEPRVWYEGREVGVGLFWHTYEGSDDGFDDDDASLPSVRLSDRPRFVMHDGATYSHMSCLIIDRVEKTAVVVFLNALQDKRLPGAGDVAWDVLGQKIDPTLAE